MATTYDLPQYIGELFQKGERPNAFLRLIGGLTGGLRTVNGTEFPMGVDYSIAAGSQQSVVEGADPSFKSEDTNQSANVVQIFQEGVKHSYSLQGRTGAITGVAVIPGSVGAELQHPGTIEFQIARAVERLSNNVNFAFLRGAYQKPANNATGRQTRGIRTAVTTNLFANGGTPRAISKSIFENALRDAMVNGMFNLGDTVQCLADATQYAALTALYESATQLPVSRDVVGVQVRVIVTKWATVELVWEPDMPAGELLLTQPKYCRAVAMPIPGKGVLFAEPLAKTGAAEPWQIYGELGIDYRHEVFHAVVDDLS